ncbi:hypothetical protein MJI47_27220, partial [Salmonella enterica subsp. enterica serovar Kentucky]|nr:hypothetical protein [Salmonella enterica subsp. enterica serovar Kentucky]
FLLALVSSTSGAAGSSILSLINTIQPKTYLNAPVPLPLKPDQTGFCALVGPKLASTITPGGPGSKYLTH